MPTRRTVLQQALLTAGLATAQPLRALALAADLPSTLAIANVTRLYDVRVARIATPQHTAEVVAAITTWSGQVSVGGGRYSMGGQIAIEGGLHLDMRRLNRLVWLDPAAKRVRVQAGMRWRDLQDLVDPHHLAIKTMQSYASFTVGGAVSVNAHGRYVGNGPVAGSVRALQLVLPDGRVAEASRRHHAELFRAAVGGYGALAAITEVELDLVDNTRIEREVRAVPLSGYVDFFNREVRGHARTVMHNADLMPPLFDAPVAVTWRRSDKPLTDPERLVPRDRRYTLERGVIWAMTELPGGSTLRRSVVQPLRMGGERVIWRNREASLDVAELEPRSRAAATYVLQEYFIPPRHFLAYTRALAPLLHTPCAEVLNVSIRHSPADADALLPWAREEVFSFVVYYKQGTSEPTCRAVGDWTRSLIDLALRHEGRYYLPYQLHASRAQFDQAYPEAAVLRELKRRHDPFNRFSNALWARYL